MIEITNYEEGQELIKKNICGVCGSPLTVAWGGAFGIDNYVVRCGEDPTHDSVIEAETVTEAYRRGAALSLEVAARVEKKITPRDINQAINIIIYKFPRAELDYASAALFLFDCYRLGLDPLLQEAVPVPFKGKGGKKLVQTIITEEGYLSLAARACPDKWAGPPRTRPVTDPELKEAICNDREAWVWEAEGRTRTMAEGQTSISYGWFKRSELEKAKAWGTPAAELPGNQARVRAIKRWVRENFPEAKAKMLEMTAVWLQRAEGVDEMIDYINAEYAIEGAPRFGLGEPVKLEAEEVKKLRQKIHLKFEKDLDIEDEKRKELIQQRYGVDSLTKLSEEQLKDCLSWVESLKKEDLVPFQLGFSSAEEQATLCSKLYSALTDKEGGLGLSPKEAKEYLIKRGWEHSRVIPKPKLLELIAEAEEIAKTREPGFEEF